MPITAEAFVTNWSEIKNAISDFQTCLSIDPQYQPASVALLEITGK